MLAFSGVVHVKGLVQCADDGELPLCTGQFPSTVMVAAVD